MADIKQVNTFANKWLEEFKNPSANFLRLVESFMREDCFALDFQMDCGQAFGEKYDSAAYNTNALKEIICDVEDIPLLGSAIFSRWRYFDHWAYTGAEILEPENREWFITALTRLEELSSDTL